MVHATRSSASTTSPGPARKIGLALGSGSARGLAHIGALRAIEDAGIKIDFIAGTSMGALIGAVFAAGQLDELEAKFVALDWEKVVSFFDVVLPKSGLLDGAKVTALVREHVSSPNIEALPIPFAAVVTDMVSGTEIAIDHGDVIDAVRASISVPGIFTPVRSNGRILVDGGLVNPVPVSVVRAMGADTVIAIDLNHEIVAGKNLKPVLPFTLPQVNSNHFGRWVDRYRQTADEIRRRLLSRETPAGVQLTRWTSREEPMPSIFEVLLASINIMETRITQAGLALDPPDLLIQPPLGHIRFLEFSRAAEIIQLGYHATALQLKEFKKTVK